jgi:hypothetical protein
VLYFRKSRELFDKAEEIYLDKTHELRE